MVEFGVFQDVVIFLPEPALPLNCVLPQFFLLPFEAVLGLGLGNLGRGREGQLEVFVLVVLLNVGRGAHSGGGSLAGGDPFGGLPHSGDLVNLVLELVVVLAQFFEFSVEGVLLGFGGNVGFLYEELVVDVESGGGYPQSLS